MSTISVIMKTMSDIAMRTKQFRSAIQTYSDRTDSVLSEQTNLHRTPNDCSMDFVLVGIAHGLGYATLTIYMT